MSAVNYSLQIDEARETAICEVRGLSKSYRNFWLNDVSFKLEPGYIMGFVGRNDNCGHGFQKVLPCRGAQIATHARSTLEKPNENPTRPYDKEIARFI